MKLLPRRPRCFLRWCRAPRFAQDYPTYILVGRWCHLYNLTTKNWFFISETMPLTKGVPVYLQREGTELIPITFRAYRLWCGRRAWLEVIEDLVGVRATGVARALVHLPVLRRIAALTRLSKLDSDQDWSRWHEYEPPKILPMGYGPGGKICSGT